MGWAYDYQCNNHATIADDVDDREIFMYSISIEH